jgi:ADP-ribose pyrophosphatase YjhB (NUDIX family)
MITFRHNGHQFGLRAAAIILHGDNVLLQRAIHDDFWAMPGGRVEFQEAAIDTLKREMLEEINTPVRVERLLWVMENFFEYQAITCHELSLYFLTHLPATSPLLKLTEFEGIEQDIKLIFKWFNRHQLANLHVYPTFFRDALKTIPSQIVHVTHVDPPENEKR